MTRHQDTIWDSFLSPVVSFLIDEGKLQRYAESIDWEKESERIRRADVTIHTYYKQNFYGIKSINRQHNR